MARDYKRRKTSYKIRVGYGWLFFKTYKQAQEYQARFIIKM